MKLKEGDLINVYYPDGRIWCTRVTVSEIRDNFVEFFNQGKDDYELVFKERCKKVENECLRICP
jgi:hypothetical protein